MGDIETDSGLQPGRDSVARTATTVVVATAVVEVIATFVAIVVDTARAVVTVRAIVATIAITVRAVVATVFIVIGRLARLVGMSEKPSIAPRNTMLGKSPSRGSARRVTDAAAAGP